MFRDTLETLKAQAAQFDTTKDFAAAAKTWKQVTQLAPDDLEALRQLAKALAKLGQTTEAIEAYELVARRWAEAGHFFNASVACQALAALGPLPEKTQLLIASLYSRAKPPPPPVLREVEVEPDFEVTLEAEPIAPATASGLPSIPLFSMLTTDELRQVLATAMEVQAFDAGEVVVTEGAPGDVMYALAEGSVGVYRAWGTANQRKVASLGTGDIFGEAAMVSRAMRMATVVTDGPAVTLRFRREAMGAIITQYPRVGAMLEVFFRQRLLDNMLRANAVVRELPEIAKKHIAERFRPRVFNDAQAIVMEGQKADAVHLLLRGSCSVTHQSGAQYPLLHEGDLFGEVSVLTDGVATATVTSIGRVLTLSLSAAEFKGLVLQDAAAAQAVSQTVKTRLDRTAQLDRQHGVALGVEDDTRV